MRAKFLFIALLIFSGCGPQEADEKNRAFTVQNITPRTDTTGDTIDVHDGRVIQFGDRYYWYGTAYGNTNGYTTANYYQCYSSSDLKTWKKEGRLLPDQPEGVYYRPHVIFNEKNQKYVLWYNWYPQLWNGQFGVAVSDTPQGPFEIINDNVPMANSNLGLGDFGLYVDDDQIAYISYNTIQNHQVSVEKLDEDYTGSTLENGGVIAKHVEAGSMFKRAEKYYLLTDYTCCFCNYGSGARVYISDSPLSGYRLTNNINRYPGRPSATLTDGSDRGVDNEALMRLEEGFQQLQVRLEEEMTIKAVEVYIFTGNRQGNCGDVSNPRVHPEFLTPKFSLNKMSLDGWETLDFTGVSVERTALREKIVIELNATDMYDLQIVPDTMGYPFDYIYINEVKLLGSDDLPVEADVFVTGAKTPQRPIIPAQQTYVMELSTSSGVEYIWMGDLWGSASNNRKGHDYQYWSDPLKFRPDGTIKPLEWVDEWSADLK